MKPTHHSFVLFQRFGRMPWFSQPLRPPPPDHSIFIFIHSALTVVTPSFTGLRQFDFWVIL